MKIIAFALAVTMTFAARAAADSAGRDNAKNAAFGAATCAGSVLLIHRLFPAEKAAVGSTPPTLGREVAIAVTSAALAAGVGYGLEQAQPYRTNRDVAWRAGGAAAVALADVARAAISDRIRVKPYKAGAQVEVGF